MDGSLLRVISEDILSHLDHCQRVTAINLAYNVHLNRFDFYNKISILCSVVKCAVIFFVFCNFFLKIFINKIFYILENNIIIITKNYIFKFIKLKDA